VSGVLVVTRAVVGTRMCVVTRVFLLTRVPLPTSLFPVTRVLIVRVRAVATVLVVHGLTGVEYATTNG